MKLIPESNPANFALHVTLPVFMLNKKFDSILSTDAQKQMFRALGTPEKDKAHILVEAGHGILAPEAKNRTIGETLRFFDHALGAP